MIFELAVGGPFHANQLRRQHRETGIASCNDCLGIGDRVVETWNGRRAVGGFHLLRARCRGSKRHDQASDKKKIRKN